MQSKESSEDRAEVLSDDAVDCAESLLEGKEGVASTLVKNLLGALKRGSHGDPLLLGRPKSWICLHRPGSAWDQPLVMQGGHLHGNLLYHHSYDCNFCETCEDLTCVADHYWQFLRLQMPLNTI